MADREAHRTRWVALVREWRDSGLTQVEFAEQRRLRLGALRAWCRRLGEAPRSRSGARPELQAARFVEVRMAASPEMRGEVELDLGGGLVLRFRGEPAPDFVGSVVAAVRARAC